ncbi:MAG: LysE family transporter [Bacteroides sp.]|nr:LysE family transporter [Bacteroides sp.]MDE7470349.1 LysE family transporter [Paramuribaculum sp.]
METALHIIYRGLMVGILISAPMGPIGVLVIHRTLTKGRRQGLFTGLGASLSDMIYCLLTGFGLSFVSDFISTHQTLLQLLGSLVLLIYGIYLFRTKPVKRVQPPHVNLRTNTTYWRDFLTGFLLTFSNPLILFFIVGLFTRFNFLDLPQWPIHHIIGYTCIAAGAVAWWLFVTYLIDKVRHKFTMNTMKKLNRVIAVLILLMAAIGLITSLRQILQF